MRTRKAFEFQSLEQRRLFAVDLAASIAVSTTGLQAGDTIAGTFTLRNLGNSSVTPTFNLTFALSTDTTFGNGDDLGSVTVPVSTDIPPGTFPAGIQMALPIPANIPAGQYFVVGKVDSGSAVSESDEGNNLFSTSAVGAFAIIDATGLLKLVGSPAAEAVTISNSGGNYSVKTGSAVAQIYSGATSINYYALGGNDSITIGSGVTAAIFDGGDGDDYIVDSEGSNTLYGGAGKDKIYSGEGNDVLRGNGGNDKLYGEAGLDRLYGYDGNDLLDGGSSKDRFFGGNGIDTVFGQGGNDLFYMKDDGSNDAIFGGSGSDSAQSDAGDSKSAVEIIIP